MIIRLVNHLRCAAAHWLLQHPGVPKNIALARALTPDTFSLVAHRPRRAPPLRLPPRSHLIYHQTSVDALCLRNSLESLAWQLPPEDEILFLDVGGAAAADAIAPFHRHAWRSYVACTAEHPEQRSYTYGLNATMHGLKAPILFVWRTDYVYPRGMFADYRRHLDAGAHFAAPYEIRVGKPQVDAAFVRAHWDRIADFDGPFWEPLSHRNSLYETQDPALFAIRRELWEKIGGLNHELWGYGWQFAEFAQRVRQKTARGRAVYFATTPPLHQTHEGSLMHQPADRMQEFEAGVARMRTFLGGEAAFQAYRLKERLPSRPPA